MRATGATPSAPPPPPRTTKLSKSLREVRSKIILLDLPQKELAARSGIPPGMISDILSGRVVALITSHG